MSMCVICDGCRKHFALEVWDGAGCETPADDEIDRNDLCRDCMAKAIALLKEFPDPRPVLRVEYYYAGPIQKGGSYAFAWSDLGITPELDQPLSEHLDVILRGRCREDWQDAVVTDLVTYTHTLTNLRFVLHDVSGWPAWWPPEGTVYIVKKEDK